MNTLKLLDRLFVTAAITIVSLMSSAECSASVQTYGFTKLTANSSSNISGQLFVDVWDAAQALTDLTSFYGAGVPNVDIAPDEVLFVFRNLVTATTPGSITQVYFDDGTLLGIPRVWDFDDNTNLRGDTDFHQGDSGPGPDDLPGGNLATPGFVTTVNFLAKADAPPTQNGVNGALDLLGISFQLQSGQDWEDTIAAFALGGADGGLRIGLHVQSQADGQSDGYINGGPLPPPPGGDPPFVPEPTSFAVWSLIVGLGAVLTSRSKR